MDKQKIDSNVEWAIRAMNDDYDFDNARRYIEAALLEVGSNKKLAYYDVLRNFITKLHYSVRGFGKKAKVKTAYRDMLHFYEREFENIQFVEMNPDEEMEMGIANSICCDVTQSVNNFCAGMRQFYVDIGLFVALGNNAKYLKEFMPIAMHVEQAACRLMKKYNNRTPQIDENIRIWEDDLHGKYSKYL